MKCPFCSSLESSVVDSRMIEEGAATRRRRKCGDCNARFTTYERYLETPLMVVKRNNRREPFNPEKIRAGILRACNKRAIDGEVIDRIVDEIEQEIRDIPNSEIKAEYVGELILEQLRELDVVAYMRFASVYKGFDDAYAFVHEAASLDSSLIPQSKMPGNGGIVLLSKEPVKVFNKA